MDERETDTWMALIDNLKAMPIEKRQAFVDLIQGYMKDEI